MKKYTTILWDLDQTLLNFDRSMSYIHKHIKNAMPSYFRPHYPPAFPELPSRLCSFSISRRSHTCDKLATTAADGTELLDDTF